MIVSFYNDRHELFNNCVGNLHSESIKKSDKSRIFINNLCNSNLCKTFLQLYKFENKNQNPFEIKLLLKKTSEWHTKTETEY